MSTQREIKFRFWSGQKMFNELDEVMACLAQQMAFNEQGVGFVGSTICYDHVGEHGASFMQYTGLRDRNGREIYEGDVLKFNMGGEEFKRPVAWNPQGFWTIRWQDGLNTGPLRGTYELIGNVYDNTEMSQR